MHIKLDSSISTKACIISNFSGFLNGYTKCSWNDWLFGETPIGKSKTT